MAIQDQSTYTEYLARSVCDTGSGTVNNLTGGTLTDRQVQALETTISHALSNSTWATTGVVPGSVYVNVAKELLPYTPLANSTSVEHLLRVSNMF